MSLAELPSLHLVLFIARVLEWRESGPGFRRSMGEECGQLAVPSN